MIDAVFAMMLPCETITPHGVPVEPEVNMRAARSLRSHACSRRRSLPCPERLSRSMSELLGASGGGSYEGDVALPAARVATLLPS